MTDDVVRFADDEQVLARVLAHVEAGTTDEGDAVWHEPVEHYRSAERFARELEVLRRSPVAFCPSAALRSPGDHVARLAAGVPVVAVRGHDGVVRAFRNACRHRGAEVASGVGCAKSLVCPFHGWTYALDGALRRVQHGHGFPDLDPDAHGLVPLHAQERSGLVFVTQVGEPDEAWLADGLPDLADADLDLLEVTESEIDAGWKVMVEGATEGYHIRFGHPETFFPYGYDNLNLVEHRGRSSRVTFPFRRIEKLAEVPPAEQTLEGRLTHVTHLFPNVLVTELSRHTLLVVFEPVAPGRTRSVSYSLARTGGDPAAIEEAQRDARFILDTGVPEDMALAESVQRNLDAAANEHLTFGRFESALVHLHRNLDAALATLGASGTGNG